MSTKIIGGEFDIDIAQFIGGVPAFKGGYYYSSGRAALYNILIYIKNHGRCSTILLPDYLCESVLQAVEASGFDFNFYAINEDLTINRKDVEGKISDNTAVLIINYFGCCNLSPDISFIKTCNENVVVVEDNVQSFYSMFNNSKADFSFTSFRKTFAAPDGAWVKSKNHDLPVANEKNNFAAYKIAGGILKNIAKTDKSIDDDVFLDLLRKGEEKIDDNYASSISEASMCIISAQPFNDIAQKRKQNAAFLIEGLKSININPILNIEEDHVPLFVPVRLQRRNEVRKALFNDNIFCPVHWPVPAGYDLHRGKELAESELSLIVDQRYGINDMELILNVLKKYN